MGVQSPSSLRLMSENPGAPDTETASPRSTWFPATSGEKEIVREQVGRILATSPFRNSKRFPAFLRHTVEHALTSTDGLKERTIGHEVFGRDPAYDTAQDPIVRMTAAEVRKRLTQYYQVPEHAGEPVISYQPGSYVPEFFHSPAPAVAVPVMPAVSAPGEPEPQPKIRVRRWRIAGATTAAVFLAILILAVARGRLAVSATAMDRFWESVVAPSAPVLLCIGDPSSDFRGTESTADRPSSSRSDLSVGEFLRSDSVRYTDAVTLALLAGELRARAKPFHIRRTNVTQLQDLRDGPVVLIGGFNNPWTLRLGEGLRFTLGTDGNGPYIRDRDRPESREWQPGPAARLRDIKQTYGLITRVQDKSTGRTVIAVSGLVLGTRAAAECLTEPACLDSVQHAATADWEHRNLQIVVASAVIGENSGAPRVALAHFW